MKKYDYLIVGAGLYGAVFAEQAIKHHKTCLVIDKREHLAGNIFTKKVANINVHVYGAHIFHTSNKLVWDYINQFANFNRFTNTPIANYQGELYNLPFNMNTFYQLWKVKTPAEAQAKIQAQKAKYFVENPTNLEEQAINLVGVDIYQKLIKGYTEKQWGQSCLSLPPFIIKRLPVRFTFDNNYFNDLYQGIPLGGYTQIVEKMLENCDVRLNCDYFQHQEELTALAEKTIFTGMIDEYYDYCYGPLEYRSLKFETQVLEQENYQGNAVINYTDYQIPYTRIIEHKHFENSVSKQTVITKEYPKNYQVGDLPYYPINNEKNNSLLAKYQNLAKQDSSVIFGGRLGLYKYYDMDDIIEVALEFAKKELTA